ncbi:MAG: DUF4102 domain-containing protein [Planctomycetaceae bacterium]|nr:DUF4102 domain-containing protein [Planctomycetaceae bacterium]
MPQIATGFRKQNVPRGDIPTKLTDRIVKNAKTKGGRYAITDATVTRLTLEITATGTKTWYYRTKVRGRVQQGRYPTVMLSAARQAAQNLTGKSAKGEQLPTGAAQSATSTPH